MMATKSEPQLGDRAFEVEWISKLPEAEYGGADWDRATYQFRIVKTKAAALRMAKKVCPGLPVEVVTVTPVELQDLLERNIASTFSWEAVGDSVHYSGDPRGFDEEIEA